MKLSEAESEADLVDGGLRYDLTVPLSRYYANNANNLPSPFKALQMEMSGERTALSGDVSVSYAVRYRYSGRTLDSGGDRADSGYLHSGGES